MKHYGDVSKINGAEVEPVDIITFGSPCQDLSVAGKRAGIQDGELDADMSGLPQQATQDSGEVQGVREESQRAGILREALSKVQEIWQPTCNKNQPIQRKYIIRRLTPLEACRLQGFPDYWCSDLGIDNPTEDEIAFWADVWETHRKIIGTSKKPKSRKQIIKWLQNPHSDSAEYKMWGNGLALPNAAHVVGCAVKLIKETQT